MPPDLVTNRFQLTLLGPVHLVEVHELFSDPHGHTIGAGPSQTSSQTLEWLERRQSRIEIKVWLGTGSGTTDRFVGSCGAFTGQRCGDDPEIGYETKRALHGHGIALEAAEAVTAAVLDAGQRRLWATMFQSIVHDGLLGSEFLDRFIHSFDVRRRRLVLLPFATVTAGAAREGPTGNPDVRPHSGRHTVGNSATS